MRSKHCSRPSVVTGLTRIGERAVRQAVLALLLQRDDLHGNVPGGRVELQVVQHRPAEHVRQEDVQRDGGGLILPRQGQGLLAAHGHDALEPLVAGQPQQDAGVMRIVLDDQQRRIAVVDVVRGRRESSPRAAPAARAARFGDADGRRRCAVAVARARVGQRQVERERAALARRAGQPDFAAQQAWPARG